MKPSLQFVRVAGLLALGTPLIPSSSAVAQPNPIVPTQAASIPKGLSVAVSDNELKMSLNVEDADVADTLRRMVLQGNLQIAARGKIAGTVSVAAQGNPEDVLQAFCKAAQLSCRKLNGVWQVEKEVAARPSQEKLLDLMFEDVEARDIIEMIAKEFDLKVSIAPKVGGKIALIRLTSMTPPQALAQVALAADLKLAEKDNVWTISPKQP